jgi:hypothetical protein
MSTVTLSARHFNYIVPVVSPFGLRFHCRLALIVIDVVVLLLGVGVTRGYAGLNFAPLLVTGFIRVRYTRVVLILGDSLVFIQVCESPLRRGSRRGQ